MDLQYDWNGPYVMFLMRADPLRGQVGEGWALEVETFLRLELATSEASDIWGHWDVTFLKIIHFTEYCI